MPTITVKRYNDLIVVPPKRKDAKSDELMSVEEQAEEVALVHGRENVFIDGEPLPPLTVDTPEPSPKKKKKGGDE